MPSIPARRSSLALPLLALLLLAAALLPAAPPAHAGGTEAAGGEVTIEAAGGATTDNSLPLNPGGQFVFWSLPDTTASEVFGTVKIAWLFDSVSVSWTSFVPALGLVNFPLTQGAVLWIVSDTAQTIDIEAGSGEKKGAPGDATEPPPSPEAQAFAQTLVDALGLDALPALFLALERGYSFDQIEQAALSGAINPDGTVNGVDPAGPPLGLIDLSSLAAAQAGLTDLTSVLQQAGSVFKLGSDFFVDTGPADDEQPTEKALTEASLLVIGFIAELQGNGYPAEQIVQQIILGGDVGVLNLEAADPCRAIRDGSGLLVVPQETRGCSTRIASVADAEAGDDTDDTDDGDDTGADDDTDGDDTDDPTFSTPTWVQTGVEINPDGVPLAAESDTGAFAGSESTCTPTESSIVITQFNQRADGTPTSEWTFTWSFDAPPQTIPANSEWFVNVQGSGQGMLFLDGPFPTSILRHLFAPGPPFNTYNTFGPILTIDGKTLPTTAATEPGLALGSTGDQIRIRFSADGHAQSVANRVCAVEWTYALMGAKR